MGREARVAKAERPATAERDGREGHRVTLDELDFLRLTSAHGSVLEAVVNGQQRVAVLQREIQAEVKAAQDRFDLLAQALATRYAFDAARVRRWDKDTCELVLDDEAVSRSPD